MEQTLEKMAYTIGLPLNCNRPVNLTQGLWREKTAVYSLQIGGFPYHKHNGARIFVPSCIVSHNFFYFPGRVPFLFKIRYLETTKRTVEVATAGNACCFCNGDKTTIKSQI